MRHSDLTIVSAYGHTTGEEAIPSIIKSMEELNCDKGLLLSPEKPNGLPNDISWRKIYSMNYWEYSPFMMHCLGSYIYTDYCLVVQDDGWVLHGDNFTEDYYKYDYIGAPSHCGKVGDKFHLQFGWYNFSDRTVVQNGGFSLRSRKFLQAPNNYGIAHRWANEIHSWNEDAQLSCLLKPVFEERGFRYAREEVAKQFSIEYVGPGFHDGFDLSTIVGHHAQSRKLRKHHVIDVPPLEVVKNMYGEEQMLSYLEEIGYVIQYAKSDSKE